MNPFKTRADSRSLRSPRPVRSPTSSLGGRTMDNRRDCPQTYNRSISLHVLEVSGVMLVRSVLKRRSMAHAYVEDLKKHVGQEVTLKGWLYNMAGKGKLNFLQVRDGTGIVQCVMSKAEVGDELFARASTLKQEASIIVTGMVREDARSPIGV